MKALIVDDIVDSRVLLRTNLEFNGFSVMEASNGQQALEMVRKSPPDLIISDVLMPVMDGFQFCRNIKQDDQLKNIPFVFYSATYTDQRDEELALKVGADRFIRKPAEPEEFVRILREVIETAEKGEIELKVRQVKDDREIFKLYDERLVKKLEQKMLDLKREITERKQTEKALREREKKYKTLLETTSEGCWLIDPGLKTVEVNQALCKMLGYSQDEMLGKTPFDFVDDENRKIFIEQTSKISGTEHRSYKITLKKKNGQDLHTHFNATTIRDESGEVQGSFAFITDITEYKRTQEERNLLPVAIDQAAESVFITDTDGMIHYVNPAFEKLTGYCREDAIGKTPRILKSGKHDASFYAEMWNTITRGEAWLGRIINRKKDGSFFEVDGTISPVFDKSGKIINFVSIKRDVTHEAGLEKRLIQAQKMQAIGTLAGGVAHDFNNILTTIIGNAHMALLEIGKDGPLREEIEEIKEAGQRAASLTRHLLAFSCKQTIHIQVIDLNELLTGIEKMLVRLIREDVELSRISGPELCHVEVDPGQMEQVIMNLAINARYAMPEGGRLTIETANEILNGDYFRSHGIEQQPGPYVVLTVSDTGIGMDEETQKQIFDPFFTTKERGRGTGLSLSTVCGIIKQNNGFIRVYSKPGQGSTFKIYLPRVKGGDVEEDKKEQNFMGEAGGSETVLIVEDDDLLRSFIRKTLGHHGYTVLEAENGEDALRVSREHQGPIELMITDVVMPRMSGQKIAERLQLLYPQMKVIYMSGYTGDAVIRHCVLAPGLNFIEKPFTPEILHRKVREVLDRGE